MKILVDENMPYAETLFSQLGEVKAVPGRPVPEQELIDADALMVRSITKVNKSLLDNTPVKFVGTATAGFDHVDIQWLSEANIGFSSAPGCNAIAVVEYVFSSLLLLAERDNFDLRDKTVGIVGVGNVGGRLLKRLQAWGVKTLLCDPPRADRGDQDTFVSLDTVLEQADILTFHTPLNMDGIYSTFHLMDAQRLANLRDGTILVNASRGEVVDNQALLSILQQGKYLSVVLDVWEPEPNLDTELLAYVDIGTPHIAGYTLEGKARGTTQVYEAYCQFLGKTAHVSLASLLPKPDISEITFNGKLTQSQLKRLIHLVYDVRRDDAALRAVAGISGEFDKLRKNYQERREWSSLTVQCDDEQTAKLLNELGFSVKI
ncbi:MULTISPECIES: 4-phosphoerythronate dehydrogenase PdxB [Providencia]|uniref:Erythronate-4-phosphate dehydrogenase n=2 Tax=Providencia rustigianii TaxID=158850 RepID=D1P5P8_9GAMM|nr:MULTISPECIES: 4-phosphoerythronate dehydrogenase PdxB [Providencia]EFB71372.1 4-phosphoerythronate dehydrogenase [Providencia rustigianii DSM 4541]MTC57887.1 4-phosphoerythronate dehydrogenase PdxB [Providencia rustigianii]MTC59357.1 4-phosphoerythronate dehydrogenase PdxB [Providencia rustigianii]SPY78014.1 Erythronate-4-phosphate dehydrogenase [Providencia rustigianii]SUC27566.1 Erythronate-4-phosphate dehydrogenase [Providencia rustigianii]